MDFSPASSLTAPRYVSSSNSSSTAHGAPIFQPSKSPSTAAASPRFAASASDYFSSVPKKRQRPDSAHSFENYDAQYTPRTATPSWERCVTPHDGLTGTTIGKGSALVNERYTLAGGFDTPSLVTTTQFERLAIEENQIHRRRLRDDDLDSFMQDDHPLLTGPLARERNGVGRETTMQIATPRTSWTTLAFSLVGKAFSFGGSMIRGFYAGAGKGYDLDKAGTYGLQSSPGFCSTPIPGAWDDGDYFGEVQQANPTLTPSVSRPPNKRRQTERESWVMVGTPDAEVLMSSPKRKYSGVNVYRTSATSRPVASRASSRRSIAPISRRTSSYVLTNGSPALNQSPLPHPLERRASTALTRSPQGRPSSAGLANSYMSPETERLAKRQAKKDRATDKTMNSMTRKLEDLIRQGQEALGTKFSVEDCNMHDFEDEGFATEDW